MDVEEMNNEAASDLSIKQRVRGNEWAAHELVDRR